MAVVGAGAAGLYTALVAAREGARVALISRSPYLLDNYPGSTIDLGSSIDLTSAMGTLYPPNQDNFGNYATIRFRHMKDTVANVLMVDGHVERFTYDPKKPPNDPHVTTLLRRNINVNDAATHW